MIKSVFRNTVIFLVTAFPVKLSAQGQELFPSSSYTDSVVAAAVNQFAKENEMIGLSIGILINGKQQFYNYGEVKKETGIAPTGKHLYDIGSIAKVFVTTLLAHAVVRNRISLEDDIRKYLPGKYPNLHYKDFPVRVLHLADHTSGLPELSRQYSEQEMEQIMKLDAAGLERFYTNYTADSLLKDLHAFEVDTIPGVRYRYNGNAMNVLQLLLQQVYQQPYDEVLQRLLSKRYNMNATKIHLSPDDKKMLVQGYDDGREEPYRNYPGYRAAPGLNSSTEDMLQFISVNLAEDIAPVRLAHHPWFGLTDSTAIGLGWMIENRKGHRMIYHSGRGSGITSLCTLHPELKTGMIIFSNNSNSEQSLFRLEKAITAALYLNSTR
ncbi:serine hydrolase domain-containing protein [Pseudobacter ginsenosidimutans]|uniref:CubicO group peptidase (Beta-lactamase class C family) n=1 Tax=Pseudobacter ginsenosidimutans TaxID=661488 RepID=A0A4Q7N5B2_9BACT|nr:serine hydrolase domain-containing protein [Pseudobacter ginsenosidimutans]QEC44748.1 beta-lactamase family protein [Pseudobacter ginsenosidimutans]RZS76232.1 CubicO group peptidase (beta-lactamase class C family) [Pseudobacter ginsenosidimutans]